MGRLADIPLAPNQKKALHQLRHQLFNNFAVVDLILYGSIVRGEMDSESDIDLLILTEQPLDRGARHQITDLVFEVNLTHDTNFSTLVLDRETWDIRYRLSLAYS
jgi:predicted nucleotidyltransferase